MLSKLANLIYGGMVSAWPVKNLPNKNSEMLIQIRSEVKGGKELANVAGINGETDSFTVWSR